MSNRNVKFANIEAERSRNGYTITDLAQELGVTRTTLSAYITGNSDIPASKLLKMSAMFERSIDYLLEVKPNRPA